MQNLHVFKTYESQQEDKGRGKHKEASFLLAFTPLLLLFDRLVLKREQR